MQINLSLGLIGLLIIGSIVVLKGLIAVLSLLRVVTTRLNKQWANKYGNKSWAIVTGCTEGIGKAFCFQLAALEFNLILIGRNEAKLQNLTKQLWQKHSNLNIQVVKADFSQQHPTNYTQIVNKFSHLDISILINDVGIASFKQFHFQSIKEISDQLKVNIDPMTFLSHSLIPIFLQRKHHSAIINLSDYATTLPLKHLSVSTATKAYNDLLSRCLFQQYKQRIDVLSLRPLIVTTAGSKYTKDWTSVSPQACARGAIKALGKIQVTIGHWFHTLLAWLSILLGQTLTRAISNHEVDKLKKHD